MILLIIDLDKLLAVGGMHSPVGGNTYSELFLFDRMTLSGNWEQVANYPSNKWINAAPITFVEKTSSFYVIGGWDGNMATYDITGFNTIDSKWQNVGRLLRNRHGHGAVWTGDALVVVGGGSFLQTETCTLTQDSQKFTCQNLANNSFNELSYPELFLFTTSYCKK